MFIFFALSPTAELYLFVDIFPSHFVPSRSNLYMAFQVAGVWQAHP